MTGFFVKLCDVKVKSFMIICQEWGELRTSFIMQARTPLRL